MEYPDRKTSRYLGLFLIEKNISYFKFSTDDQNRIRQMEAMY